MEYHQCFETLASPLENLPETMLEGHFINGLKPNIKVELRPRGLEQMMDLAQCIEEQNQVVRGGAVGSGLNKGQATPNPISIYQRGGILPPSQQSPKSTMVNPPNP